MRDVTDLKVTQIRLFPADTIPFGVMLLQTNVKAVVDAFGFSSSTTVPASGDNPPALEFAGGSLGVDGREVLVEAIRIEPRRIVTTAFAASRECDQVYAYMKGVLEGLDPVGGFAGAEPSTLVQETACTATLDVPFDAFFADAVRRFSADLPRSLSTPFARVISRHARFAIEVRYMLTDESLILQGITLNPKAVIIEPRAGTAPESSRYFTASPTDSETHLRLVQELESALSRAGLPA